jgi:hypothetical protein
MIHIKLGDRRPVTLNDVMARDWVGYDPKATLDQLFARNRGTWKLNGSRAGREDYVVFSYTGDHKVKLVAEIDGFEDTHDGRIALIGRVLELDDPISLRWVGAWAPDGNRNPVHYFYDAASPPSRCGCGCGEPVPAERAFLPGHDQKAVRDRISEQWGDTLKFIKWYDQTFREN